MLHIIEYVFQDCKDTLKYDPKIHLYENVFLRMLCLIKLIYFYNKQNIKKVVLI